MVALETRIRNDQDLHALKATALKVPTDLERRHWLKSYYELYFKKLRARATTPDLKAYLDAQEATRKLSLLQPKVRHESDEAEAAALAEPVRLRPRPRRFRHRCRPAPAKQCTLSRTRSGGCRPAGARLGCGAKRRVRLVVRTQPSQGWCTGSIPVHAAARKCPLTVDFHRYNRSDHAQLAVAHGRDVHKSALYRSQNKLKQETGL